MNVHAIDKVRIDKNNYKVGWGCEVHPINIWVTSDKMKCLVIQVMVLNTHKHAEITSYTLTVFSNLMFQYTHLDFYYM